MGTIDSAVDQVLANFRAADDFLIVVDRLHRNDGEPEFLAEVQQILDAALPIASKVVVVPLNDFGDADALNDISKIELPKWLTRELIREADGKEQINTELLTKTLLLLDG